MNSKSSNGVFLFNPLPWERKLEGQIASHVVNPRGIPTDETAGRHFQDRDYQHRGAAGLADSNSVSDLELYHLLPTTVPGYGWTVVPVNALVSHTYHSFSEQSTVKTDRYVLKFDRSQGGLESWYDIKRDYEWVDRDSEYSFAGFVHEQVADTETERPRKRLFDFGLDVEDPLAAMAGMSETASGFQSDWYAHRSEPTAVKSHRVYEIPEGYEVRQVLVTPQVESNVMLRFLIPQNGETIVVDAQWDMNIRTHPEATYLTFPVNLNDPTPRLDVGGRAIEPGRDQLTGSTYDYYTLQNWADLSDTAHGMTFGCPINPMVQFGDFHFAENRTEFMLARSLLLGWVTNNYWDTNFRAHQPGRVRAQYHLSPHDTFTETAAHRKGLESLHFQPLAQTFAERDIDNPPLPETGQFLNLPNPPIFVTQIRPVDADSGVLHPDVDTDSDRDDRMLISLCNVTDKPHTGHVVPAALQIESAVQTDPTGKTTHKNLRTTDSGVSVEIDGRESMTIRIDCQQAN